MDANTNIAPVAILCTSHYLFSTYSAYSLQSLSNPVLSTSSPWNNTLLYSHLTFAYMSPSLSKAQKQVMSQPICSSPLHPLPCPLPHCAFLNPLPCCHLTLTQNDPSEGDLQLHVNLDSLIRTQHGSCAHETSLPTPSPLCPASVESVCLLMHDLKLAISERAKSGFMTASNVVDIVSSPEMQAHFLQAEIHKPSISDSTACCWLSKLGHQQTLEHYHSTRVVPILPILPILPIGCHEPMPRSVTDRRRMLTCKEMQVQDQVTTIVGRSGPDRL